MWLFTTKGFYSVVEHREDSDYVLVRARVRKDLEALIQHMPTMKILETKNADYRYRAVVPRREWLATMLEIGDEIDYDNFKDAVKRRQGKKRADTYMRVWSAMLQLQPIRWGRRRRRRHEPNLESTLDE
jgi:hypothetical protein